MIKRVANKVKWKDADAAATTAVATDTTAAMMWCGEYEISNSECLSVNKFHSEFNVMTVHLYNDK